MENFFQLKKRNTTVKTEVLAGITTFMAMAYALMVNANMFTQINGQPVSYRAVYIATAIAAVVGTLFMGLVANLPLALASGMGLNAFFVYTVCNGFGLTYANALTLVLLNGVVFVILTLTGFREKIIHAIPVCVRSAIPVGIGLFIAFLGLQSSGLIVPDSSTCVTLASFNLLNKTTTWASVMPLLVTLFSLFLISILAIKQIKGYILYGILSGTGLYYLLGLTIDGFYDSVTFDVHFNPFSAFREFFDQSFMTVFTQGFDYSAYLESHSTASLIMLILTTALAFCLVDLFDTIGTLYGACQRGNLLTKEGTIPNVRKAMLADAIATVVGSMCGTSTNTTFVESSAGIAEGGRTGLSSVVTGTLFFVAMFLSPITQLIPTCATAATLIYVGVLMVRNVTEIDWSDPQVAVPAFLTMILMPLTYNVSYGIAFGLISYVLICCFCKKAKEIKLSMWILTILFAVMFFVTH